MKGKTVITSKQIVPFEVAKDTLTMLEDINRIDKFHIRERGNYVLWDFHDENDAAWFARWAMNNNFEYVQRVV